MNERRTIISVRDAVKRFGGVTAVDHVSIDIAEGEFFALLGPSGCGKTTLLRMIAGFEVPSSGQVLIDSQDMADVAPNRRPVNMVFQSYAVFPHMTVFDNVGYGLKVTSTPKIEIRERVMEALALVQMEAFAARKPDQLSGGQRQRVALARALVKRPKVLLLDEPLSALDAKLREAMQLELVKLQATVGITFVIVTHDQDEALSMADRIAVLENGRVRQIASPVDLYEYPCSRFVADFIGKMNVFEARANGFANDSLTIDVDGLGSLNVPHPERAAGALSVAVRPEKMRLLTPGEDRDGLFAVPVTIRNIAYHGSESHVFAVTESGLEVSATIPNRSRDHMRLAAGDAATIGWRPADTLVLVE